MSYWYRGQATMHETRVTGSLESLAYFLACFPGPDRLTSGCVSLEDYIRSNSTELVIPSRKMLSQSDSLALAFGLISTFLAILTVIVTRVNHPSRAVRDPQYIDAFVVHPQEIVLEEMRLRRWSSMRRNNTERLRLEE
ncbi:hypothetical protein NA56DRAFT_751648 [Hyaloscypha hepaticicola]|uniref:Uncharacterized protein n=1 Tax=Hyaloscypha hepaticicola TaxID=2082293 RepID=A0A2J6PWE7_9HELO|nr:hypothetical protein NA56DRAFT_751648 [Hyaloscypha hepaticicola]